MNTNKSKNRIILAFSAIIILLGSIYSVNTQYVDATFVASKNWTATNYTLPLVGRYNQGDDIVLAGEDSGISCFSSGHPIRVFDGATLTSLHNGTLPGCPQGGSGVTSPNEGSDNIECDDTNDICVLAVEGFSGSQFIRFTSMEMTGAYSKTTYSNTTYLGCRSYGTAISGDSIYIVVDSCSTGSNSGIWKILYRFIGDGIAGNDGQIITKGTGGFQFTGGTGLDDGCYDATTGKIVFSQSNGNFVKVYNPLTSALTFDINVAAFTNHVACLNNGKAIVSSIAGDWIKLINLSTGSVMTTTGLVNADDLLYHDGRVYSTISGSNTIAGMNYLEDTPMSIDETITGFNAGSTQMAIQRGNTTRINAFASNEYIYAVGLNFIDNPNNPPGTGTSVPGSGIDCTLPENANILICRLGGNSTTVGVGGIIRDGFLNLGCNIIFVDCDESSDPRTNGLGLLLFIASIFVIVGMFYYVIGTEAFHMPLFIWIVIIIALSAFFTITGLIDPVFLILSIIAIVALAAPKVVNTIRGGTFGGGSSA